MAINTNDFFKQMAAANGKGISALMAQVKKSGGSIAPKGPAAAPVYVPPAAPPQPISTTATPKRLDARVEFGNMLRGYGFNSGQVNSLLSDINARIAEGYESSVIMDAFIPMSSAYKERFKGNEARIAAGKSALSPSEYMALENSYRSVLSRNGMPADLWDNNDDFAAWIQNDVSPDEIAARAGMANELVNTKPPETLKALKDYYGINKGDIASFYLDRKKGETYLQKIAAAAEIGGEAARQGLALGRQYSESIVELGIDAGAARSAFSDVAATKDDFSKLAKIDETSLSVKDLTDTALGINPNAGKKIKKLASQERARFSGSNAGTRLAGNNISGSF